ncbi:MAG: RNA polymerase sigma factor [Planctomycetaceae bacterium]
MTNGHAGNADWVHGLLIRHEADLTRYARRIVRDDERARDVVQETFLKLCREDRQQVDGHHVEWLYTVCRNQALDVRRKEERMTALAEATITRHESREPGPAVRAEQHDAVGHLLSLVGELPTQQQEAIRLKFQQGLSYKQISAVTGLSVSHVGVLIHTGLKTLRTRLQRAN